MPPKKYVVPRAAATATASVAQPKQRKPRAPLSKPPGMTNAEWRAEVQRREAVTANRRNRAITKKARDNAARAAAVSADQAEAEATRVGMRNPPGSHAQYAPWGQQGVGSPSPQPWGCTPSPGYADGDAHGGFNPNVTFPHGHPAQRTPSPAFAGVQYPPYNYSPPAYTSSPTPPLRRGVLPFSHLGDTDETEADMDDIIVAGSAAAAASPGFVTPDDTVDLNGGMDGELGYVYGEEEPEEQEEEDEEEEEEEPATVPARRHKKKKRAARSASRASSGRPRSRNASPKHGKSSASTRPPARTRASRRTGSASRPSSTSASSSTPYFKGVYMQRRAKAMANHWGLIQGECNKWHGIVEEVAARPESGASVEDQLLRMFAMYRQGNSDVEFEYLHVYKRIDKCEKWAEVRHTLDKAKETYKPDAPTPGASEGRSDGNKGAKKGKHANAATARVQESIEHCLADAQARAALHEEKTEARWSALMSSSAVKLDLLRTNIAAKKRNTDLAFLLGVADMLQSNDEAVKAWYLAERGLILNHLPSTTTTTPTPTPPPSSSDDAAATPRSTEATPTPPSTETPPSPRMPTPPTPEADLAV
ncbi:uncharacterized protein [Aegilops tauschii subsp. strangulata]|uniref:uncharacterized protein n=1 Tax=Aegilops tauschii subsp. strangulata TaxID=200361 RepID=UPI003CC83CEC